MEEIQKVREDFSSVKETRKSVEEIFDSLSEMIESLQSLYEEYMQRGEESDDRFGVDSIHFQQKYISEERDGLKKMFAMINNQIYKDHYKLHKHMSKYVDENIKDKEVRQACCLEGSYTEYDDQDPYKEYDFEEVYTLHQDITEMISVLLGFVNERDEEVKDARQRVAAGFNIDNIVATEKFNNMAIESKARLFLEYLRVFNKFHISYFSRFNSKLQLSHSQILNDLSAGCQEEEQKEEVSEEKSEEEQKEETAEEQDSEAVAAELKEEAAEEQAEEECDEDCDNASADTGVLESEASIESDGSHFANDSSEVVLEVSAARKSGKGELTEQQIKWQMRNRERMAKRREQSEL